MVARSAGPVTVQSLVDDLRVLGVQPGTILIVHSSLSRLGWVAGAAHAVVLALLQAVGAAGTLLMPTHSTHLTDPAGWRHPPVPRAWWPVIRAQTPAFDPALTPTRNMGAVVECFRHLPGVVRSEHPTVSFAAHGPAARRLTTDHGLAYGLGEHSPPARVYELDGQVLLLGVDHANNTSLHLAEYRASFPGKRWVTQASPLLVAGQHRWVSYPDLDGDSSDFARLGEDFAAEPGREQRGAVGSGLARLMSQRAVVDFAVRWMEQHRTLIG